jgi:hypothetical protein
MSSMGNNQSNDCTTLGPSAETAHSIQWHYNNISSGVFTTVIILIHLQGNLNPEY